MNQLIFSFMTLLSTKKNTTLWLIANRSTFLLKKSTFLGNLHKWMYAPRGCAILHVKRNHHDWVKSLVTSFGYNTSFQDGFGYKGTRDDSPYCTVPEAIKFYNAIGGYVSQVILKIYKANSTFLSSGLRYKRGNQNP
jgi:hypothetical protein